MEEGLRLRQKFVPGHEPPVVRAGGGAGPAACSPRGAARRPGLRRLAPERCHGTRPAAPGLAGPCFLHPRGCGRGGPGERGGSEGLRGFSALRGRSEVGGRREKERQPRAPASLRAAGPAG